MPKIYKSGIGKFSNGMNRRLAIPLFLTIALFVVYLSFNFRTDVKIVDLEKPVMGTIVQIKVPVDRRQEEGVTKSAVRKAFAEMERVEAIFSVYKRESEISKINRLETGEALKVQEEVFNLIERSIVYTEKTKGVFDITVKPLVDLWNAAKAEDRLPTDDEIKNALDRIGSQYVILDRANQTISFKKEGMALDLGGIAKGYATDRAIKILKESNIRNAIVNSGGDMYCLGRKSEGTLWNVGIQHPRRKGEICLEIELENMAIDTSGDYEKYFLLGGRRYSHIINPRTGYPIGDNIVSASIITKDSAAADALATALCILGRDGLDIINSMEETDAILILKEGDKLKIELSEGLKARYGLIEKAVL